MHFAHASGDAINAVLAVSGYNFRRRLLNPYCLHASQIDLKSAFTAD
jgi:hypothetical protein